MYLSITTTHTPATDLGYLLGKHPARLQTFDLSFGQAHVFYAEASATRCTAVLALDIDPVGLSRGKSGAGGRPLEPYVNDRPYVSSSFLSVALAQVYSTALAGRSRERGDLAQTPIPLVATTLVRARGGELLLRRLFEPLGYTVTTQGYPLDDRFPTWGASDYYTLTLTATCRLSDLLTHLYVLIPVLDTYKHYWIGDDEVEKLLRHGEGWLAVHPDRDLIVHRYLKRRRHLTNQALAQLVTEAEDEDETEEVSVVEAEEPTAAPLRLNQLRLAAVVEALKASGARRVLDLGCGEGQLMRALLPEREFEEIVGVDVSTRALELARDRLHLDRLAHTRDANRIRLLHGSLMYRDSRLAGFDAAAVVEVIEHLDPPRLAAFERVVFEFARPKTVIVTTPNIEYNVLFATLTPGKLRHSDHRFEWTRAELRAWATGIAGRFGYQVHLAPIGPDDATVGPPTQMAVFTL